MAFRRKYRLVVAPLGSTAATLAQGIDVSQLRCTFKVKKTLTPAPNHADIRVYNLNTFSQALLSNSKALSISLDAGYEDEGTSRIYLGEIRTADTKQHGPECITKMTTDDKGRKLQTYQINNSVRPGAPIKDVIKLILGSLNGTITESKIGEGNLERAMQDLEELDGMTTLHPRGGVLSGYAVQELTDLCKGANLEWSIQDGNLFLIRTSGQYGKRSLVLSDTTGLIKSPTVDNEGFVTAETLILPGLYPGAVVDFDAKFLKGGYRLTQVEYHGDTHGQDWHAKLKGTRF